MTRLPDATRIGRVDLTVRDLDREVRFYRDALGLRVLREDKGYAELGADAPIVGLHEDATAPPRPRVAAGLYHMAVLLPTRRALGGLLRRLAPLRVLEGASDHAVSEALYLSDPEGNGIEVYADRPRDAWPRAAEGGIGMTTQSMDVDGVLAEAAAPLDRMPDGTRMGHVHLQVGDVPAAEAWYRDLGFDVTARYGPQASFLSAGGYHHHVAVNAWQSRGAPPARGDELGLRSFTVVVPGIPEAREMRDPAGNVVRLAPGS